jgi:hypothetical protein
MSPLTLSSVLRRMCVVLCITLASLYLPACVPEIRTHTPELVSLTFAHPDKEAYS